MESIKNHWENTLPIEFSVQNVLLLLVGIASVVYILGILTRKYKLPPGPVGLPWLGYLPFLGKKPYETLRDLSKKYGNVMSMYLGRSLVIVCSDWDTVKEVFSKASTAYRPPGLFDALPNGLGLGGANGQEWTEQRRFSVKAMKDIGLGRPKWEELIQEEVDEVTEQVKTQKGKSLDLVDLLSDTFAKNIMTLLLGYRLKSSDPAPRYVSKASDYVIHAFPALSFPSFLPKLYGLSIALGINPSPLPKLLEFSDYIKNLVIKKLKSQNDDDEDSFIKKYFEEVQNNKKNNSKNSFTDDTLYGNTHTLILGGTDTTRTSLIWLLVAMAEHPDIQDKVHQELDNVLGKDGSITWAERSKIPYTFACILEGQRWRSIAPINTQRSTNEHFKINGFDVPKNAIIVSNIWGLHNDPKYWPQPEKYRPERFLLDEGKQINFKPDSYAPFSFGKRSCPGELIASIAVLLYFVRFMQKFRVYPDSGKTVKHTTILGLTLQPLGVKLRFEARD